MPTPIPDELIVNTSTRYLLRRQIELQEPTTVQQLSRRMGLGGGRVQEELERAGLRFFLVPLQGENSSQSQTLIYLQNVPQDMLDAYGYRTEHLQASISFHVGTDEPDSLPRLEEEPPAPGEDDHLDPYAVYQIDEAQFEALREELITWYDIYEYAKPLGYTGGALKRAVGGDKMVLQPVGPFWRPYVFRGTRYYLREVLNHLEESDFTYKKESTRQLKKRQRDARNRNHQSG